MFNPLKKKEFVTTWSRHPVDVHTKALTISQQNHFDPPERAVNVDVVLPDDIRFLDLLPYVGVKTKITIEVVPW